MNNFSNLQTTTENSLTTVSNSTQQLEQLQKRIPIVSDKAIIDLVNGIHINQDIVNYRKNRGFFGQIFDKLDGSDRQRQLLLDGNIKSA